MSHPAPLSTGGWILRDSIWTRERLEERAAEAAQSFQLDRAVVFGMIQRESSWDPTAWNPEPRFRWMMNVRTWKPFRQLTAAERASETPPADFPALAGDRDQEWWAQQASWGLLQVMGSVARERGYALPFLTGLVDPVTNLVFGLKHLKHLMRKRTLTAALLRYNGGGNPHYPDEVLQLAEGFRV